MVACQKEKNFYMQKMAQSPPLAGSKSKRSPSVHHRSGSKKKWEKERKNAP